MLRAVGSRCFWRAAQQNTLWAVRGFADAPATKASAPAPAADVNWDAFDSLISSDEGRRELASLRSAISSYQQKLDDMAKPPIKINWDSYKGQIDKDLLAAMKEAYTGLKLPTLDVAAALKEVDEKFKPLIADAEEMAAYSKKRAAEIKEEIKQIDAEMARLDKVTIDEEMAAHPDIATEVDKEISDGRFY